MWDLNWRSSKSHFLVVFWIDMSWVLWLDCNHRQWAVPELAPAWEWRTHLKVLGSWGILGFSTMSPASKIGGSWQCFCGSEIRDPLWSLRKLKAEGFILHGFLVVSKRHQISTYLKSWLFFFFLKSWEVARNRGHGRATLCPTFS